MVEKFLLFQKNLILSYHLAFPMMGVPLVSMELSFFSFVVMWGGAKRCVSGHMADTQ